MATSTLPMAVTKLRKDGPLSGIGEFGAHNAALANNPNDWDEEVVPALRRRLEEESSLLEKRISRMDVQRLYEYQSRQNGRPAPRFDRNDEIIQDGLGSDDLIPSEWVTGSKAQFARLTPRMRNHLEEGVRSVSDSYNSTGQQHTPYHDPLSLRLPSPPSPSGSSPSSVPPSPTQGEDLRAVVRAREKARKLARERETRAPQEQTMRGNASPKPEFTDPGWLPEEGEEEKDGGLVAGGEGRERIRTLSTPNAYDPLGAAKRQRYPPKNRGGNPDGLLHRTVSKASLRDEDSPPSKIPLPKSGSMSKYQDQYTWAAGGMRKSKSAGRMITSAAAMTPPHQDGVAGPTSTQPSGLQTMQQGQRQQARRQPAKLLDNSPPTQDVLDEFGPLGGTARARRGPEWMETKGAGKGDNVRSASNPWDEEMLPTVKRRLEQQMILESLSRDDGYVDTWDRNGLPLTKAQLVLRKQQQAKEEGGKKGQSGTDEERRKEQRGEAELSQLSPWDSEAMQPVRNRSEKEEESVQRMKRLQEQLGAGIDSTKDGATVVSEAHNGPNSVLESRSATAERASKEPKKGAGATQAPVEDAGCCKCTIM